VSRELLDLWKRRLEPFGSTNRGNNDFPAVRTALQGTLNGDLTIHYARWLRSRYIVDREVILEVAYWIGPSVGTAPSEEVRARYRQNSHTDPQDRWVVFHFHIPIDANIRFGSRQTAAAGSASGPILSLSSMAGAC
jgi:chitinase